MIKQDNDRNGANCAYHPKLSDLTTEQVMLLWKQIKLQEKAVGDELRKRIYQFEKRTK